MAKPLEVDDEWNERIVSSLNGMEYGAVQIIVHDGRIVQIERTERKRFDGQPEKRTDFEAKGNPKGRR
ncbi:YezD family protein [Gorillibacterium timonense]|uniref:YezD family protein n=1 Tax=Gorillibacterium timonense TaxID=1689269 RepID=UPI00071DFB5F|nr:YezD family protein [Gorillibacterium timonense]